MKLCAHHTMSHDCEVCHENPEPSPLEFQFVWKETLGMYHSLSPSPPSSSSEPPSPNTNSPSPAPNRKAKPMSDQEIFMIQSEIAAEAEQRGFDDPDNRPDHEHIEDDET